VPGTYGGPISRTCRDTGLPQRLPLLPPDDKFLGVYGKKPFTG
jgi:hypothetical protein